MVNILSFHGVQVFFYFSVMISSSCAPGRTESLARAPDPTRRPSSVGNAFAAWFSCMETAAWDANLMTIDKAGGVAGPAQSLLRPSLALSNLKGAFQGYFPGMASVFESC